MLLKFDMQMVNGVTTMDYKMDVYGEKIMLFIISYEINEDKCLLLYIIEGGFL